MHIYKININLAMIILFITTKIYSSSIKTSKLFLHSKLNTAQLNAVQAPINTTALCIAGPGSGKTRVLIHRIQHLVEFHDQPSKSIVALTFTNKAASEMKTRLAGLVGHQSSREMFIGTFHSFCSRLLRSLNDKYLREITKCATLDNRFVIYGDNECISIIKEILKKYDLSEESTKPSTLLESINKLREAKALVNSR